MPLNVEQRERYLRHILLREIGAQGQQKLLAARVLVIGAGGLGAPMIEYLAAAGVGALGLVDDDTIALSNLQRQVIYRDEDVGALKVERAAAFARALNPDVTVIPYTERVDEGNAARLMEGFDFVLEGVDSFEARFALNAAAIQTRTPLLSAAIGRFEGQVSLYKPWADPRFPCYRCLVPETPPRDASVNCAEEGVIGPLAGVVGALAALEALKEIAGVGEPLAGRLLLFDGLAATMRSIALPRDPECAACGAVARGP